MKKVLILTYYWPPSGGIGVQRWLQFSKNLPDYGWKPIIFTAKNANYPIVDEKLLTEVPENIEILRVRVPEPNNLVSLIKKSKNKSRSIYKLQQQSGAESSTLKRLLWTIRGNFFIPDARMFWINKSYRYLNKYLIDNKVDAIISTGPPHSAHLIAMRIQEKHRIPWISDFRDPWTSMDYLKQMNLKKFALKKHRKLEKAVLERSTHVMVVGRTIQNEFEKKYNIPVSLIYNGYNSTVDESVPVNLDKKFSIVHTGSFLHNRNCDDLWNSLAELVKSQPKFAQDLELKLVGNVAPIVATSIKNFGLSEFTTFIPHVNHATAKEIQMSAQLLLLPIDRIENAEFVLTGKLFEYLQAKRPIICIGPPHGDAADVINSCDAGTAIAFEDIARMKQVLLEKYKAFCDNNNTCNSVGIKQFSYSELTKKVVDLLNNEIHD